VSVQEDSRRAALWAQAQAQSAAYSARTTQVYAQLVLTRPGNIWSPNSPGSADSGSPIYGGSFGPGTFTTNGQPV